MKLVSVADLEILFTKKWTETNDLRATLAAIRYAIVGSPGKGLALVSPDEYEAPKTAPASVVVPLLIERFAAANGIRPEQITGRDKTKATGRVRWEVMWAAREVVADLGTAELGRLVGGRCHKDVLRGLKIVEARIAEDPGLAARILRIAGVAGVEIRTERPAALRAVG